MSITPARLSFLAIYNPSLGPTDDQFRDQLVFYYSRAAHEARVAAKKSARNDAAGADALRAEENEKLRQIGLAQGMVGFAQSFSDGEPVDSIETEKSRIVLRELEKGWWILASIDLTRLPSLGTLDPTKKDGEKETKPAFEYSSREVSPSALLIQQLLQAHYIFCLHHGPSLSDLFVRLSREKFCSTLDRYWSRFSRSWDVLLHGNPAVDIFSGLKLASGGELGYGVGEEEWGSGERDVLEDLTRRTEGLVDVFVSRFGEAAPEGSDNAGQEAEALPWMGRGVEPVASDGLIFSGIGSVERHSIRDVSLWMRQIYTYGEHAYGVRDNPLRERRKRRRRNPPEHGRPANGSIDKMESTIKKDDEGEPKANDSKRPVDEQEHSSLKVPEDKRPEIHPRVASHDHATTPEETPTPPNDSNRPNIPPPIVVATENALAKATQQADNSTTNQEEAEDSGTTLGIPDQYMKYLTFGLSTLGKSSTQSRPTPSRQSSEPAQSHQKDSTKIESTRRDFNDDDDDLPTLTHLEPMPDGETLKAKIALQKHLEAKGHFLIGLKGDLDKVQEDEDADMTDGSLHPDQDGSRIVLRTLQVELVSQDDEVEENRADVSDFEPANLAFKNFRRLRVLVYVHRPFMYCLLFGNRTSSLQWGDFYKSLHQNLQPIHKALLSSTDVGKIAQRIESSHTTAAESGSASDPDRNKLPFKGSNSAPIFDLLYDPRLLTLHTSIPNIPEPGTPAAEGILTAFKPDVATTVPLWTRIEALNVHSQILNTLHSVKSRKNDVERTSKTTRGWWIVWMKVPPSAAAAASNQESDARSDQNVQVAPADVTITPQPDMHRVAFLVRKSSDTSPASKSSSSTTSRAVSSMFSNMSLGLRGREEEKTGGAGAGWGPAALAGGIGVDARRYVEGLLSLNR